MALDKIIPIRPDPEKERNKDIGRLFRGFALKIDWLVSQLENIEGYAERFEQNNPVNPDTIQKFNLDFYNVVNELKDLSFGLNRILGKEDFD